MKRAAMLCVVAATAVAGGVQAADLTLLIDASRGSAEKTGSSARLVLSFTEVGSDDRLNLAIENTTAPALGSALTAVGFEIPGSWAATFAPGGKSSYFDELQLDVAVSPGWLSAAAGYDLMLTSDRNFEGGSPQGAPRASEVQSVVLSLGDTGLTPAALAATFTAYYAQLPDPYVIGRFQSVGPGGALSDKVGGGVPEPATLLLLVAGSVTLRRRRDVHRPA